MLGKIPKQSQNCFTLPWQLKIHRKSEDKDEHHDPSNNQIDGVGGIGAGGQVDQGVDRPAEFPQRHGGELKGIHSPHLTQEVSEKWKWKWKIDRALTSSGWTTFERIANRKGIWLGRNIPRAALRNHQSLELKSSLNLREFFLFVNLRCNTRPGRCKGGVEANC